jgi:hypothetical protein
MDNSVDYAITQRIAYAAELKNNQVTRKIMPEFDISRR